VVEPSPEIEEDTAPADPRRWITLSIVIAAVVLISIDVSVLNVAIPTILVDLHTTVPTLEWVITGYALTFASLLIVGGRLGDIFGHRRMFIIGAVMFGTGSLIASVAPSVGVLIVGEALVEGIGAALMSPATHAIITTTVRGRERATAFAVWGTTIGAAVAFGPLVGGFLTTNYSWRWAFRINVVVAPIAIIGAWLFMPVGARKRRTPIDFPGAVLIALGTFSMVFALSQGGTYGWWEPTASFVIGSVTIWPTTAPISIGVAAFSLSAVVLTTFYFYERRKDRLGNDPLFEFSELRHKTYRYGLVTGLILSLGQLGLLFTLALYLQEARHLSAEETGLWTLPIGLAVFAGAQVGGRLTRVITPTSVARIGLATECLAFVWIYFTISPSVAFLTLLPGFVLFGFGIGAASAQLTNVILSEVSMDKSGVASGANTTARQVGTALGAAVIGSLITAQTINHALASLSGSGLGPAARDQAAATVSSLGPNATVPDGLSAIDASNVSRLFADAVTSGARAAVAFGGIVVLLGTLLSLLIPRVKVAVASTPLEVLETFDDMEPMIGDPRRILRRAPFDTTEEGS
jgi:EmrB/QacA subfamily drug resistance transporter